MRGCSALLLTWIAVLLFDSCNAELDLCEKYGGHADCGAVKNAKCVNVERNNERSFECQCEPGFENVDTNWIKCEPMTVAPGEIFCWYHNHPNILIRKPIQSSGTI